MQTSTATASHAHLPHHAPTPCLPTATRRAVRRSLTTTVIARHLTRKPPVAPAENEAFVDEALADYDILAIERDEIGHELFAARVRAEIREDRALRVYEATRAAGRSGGFCAGLRAKYPPVNVDAPPAASPATAATLRVTATEPALTTPPRRHPALLAA